MELDRAMEGGSDIGYGTGERMEVGWYCRRPSNIAELEAISALAESTWRVRGAQHADCTAAHAS